MTAIEPIRIGDKRRQADDLTAPIATQLERMRGEARIAVRAVSRVTRLETFYQSGSAKIRLPSVATSAPLEAVFLNTAGGITGGDRISYGMSVGDSASLVVTTQAAERIYRRSDGIGEVSTTIDVAAHGRLDWLPQETILFDRSALSRRLLAEVDPTATLLAVESVVLGRAAMGERIRDASMLDSWRIRRGGKLVFADSIRFNGDATAIMAGSATGNGATALATIVLVAPDAESRIGTAREVLRLSGGEGGASAWNGILVARMIAHDGRTLRSDLMRLIEALRGIAMPRVWHC